MNKAYWKNIAMASIGAFLIILSILLFNWEYNSILDRFLFIVMLGGCKLIFRVLIIVTNKEARELIDEIEDMAKQVDEDCVGCFLERARSVTANHGSRVGKFLPAIIFIVSLPVTVVLNIFIISTIVIILNCIALFIACFFIFPDVATMFRLMSHEFLTRDIKKRMEKIANRGCDCA